MTQRTRAKLAPGLVHLFMLIAEPRVARVIQLGIYLTVLGGGLSAFFAPPTSTVWVLGTFLTGMWALFLIVGGLLGAIAVLPGIWWLERAAVIGVGAGIAMYGVVILSGPADSPGNAFTQACLILALLLSQVHRWTQIRRYQLAPKG